jgi:hypothetical protein
MVGYPLRNTLSDHGSVNRGVCKTDESGFLTDVEEIVDIARDADGIPKGTRIDGSSIGVDADSPVSMNFWGFTQSYFPKLEEHFTSFLKEHGSELKSECYIPTVVDDLVSRKMADCTVLETTASWFGVTYPDDKPHVVESIAALTQKGTYPSPLS